MLPLPSEPFLLGNQWIDPDYHIPVGIAGPSELGVFWLEHDGISYYWLTPEERHQHWWETEAAHHVAACPRRSVAKLLDRLPLKYLAAISANATRACCQSPLDHDIEAFYVSEKDKSTSHPDMIYVLHCTCGRKHRRQCVGVVDNERPLWE